MITDKEGKTWFFLLCEKLPKINESIFLIIGLVAFDSKLMFSGLLSD